MPSTEQRLRLAAHVRACSIDEQVILLDLSRGKYIGIAGSRLNTLVDQIDGWPTMMPTAKADNDTGSVDADLATTPLVAQGLLARGPRPPAMDAQIVEATASLDSPTLDTPPGVTARRILRFLHSSATAAIWLRFRSLHVIAGLVATRRDLVRTANPLKSIAPLCESAAMYERLRPFIHTARDKCLHDSLAMTLFLQREGLPAHWVIGVKTRPFGAHSWVQSGATVLNDHHDHVRQFTPILAV